MGCVSLGWAPTQAICSLRCMGRRHPGPRPVQFGAVSCASGLRYSSTGSPLVPGKQLLQREAKVR